MENLMSLSRLQLALAASALVLPTLSVHAEDAAGPADPASAASPAPFDVGIAAGTAGLGVQFAMQVLPQSLAIRAVVNGLSYHHDTTSNGVDYKGKLKLNNQSLLLDWTPFSGSFRFSAGMVFNHNSLRLDGKPDSATGTYEVNGNTYTAAQVGVLTAAVKFHKASPYLGLGWGGSPESGLHFIGDIGVIAQGKPKATLTDSGGGGVSASDLQQSQDKLQHDLDKFRWYPVVQLGVGYRF
jgi:hypothetical protein